VPNDEERAASLAAVPWRVDINYLATHIHAALKKRAVDLIDASIGPNHCRTVLVALYEGVEIL
jgi:hypothetical protein